MSVLLKVSYATITVIIFNFLGYREMERDITLWEKFAKEENNLEVLSHLEAMVESEYLTVEIDDILRYIKEWKKHLGKKLI
jgi:biopolymer transport protein ExbB/TolQ